MSTATTLPQPSRDWALFLDVDGTLVEIAETPESVAPDTRLPVILAETSRILGGAVALVSGRRIATLDRILHPLRLPAAGLHGLERRTADGRVTAADRPPELVAATEAITDFAARHEGLVVEDKGATVALHYRMAPVLGPAVVNFVTALADELGGRLFVQRGKMVVELRPKGDDKGTVIRAFMDESPFAGRVPVFVGDDVTDEAGFEAVNRLGGNSIRIGPAQPTAARFRIPSVRQLISWLALLSADTGSGDMAGRAGAQ